MTKTLGAGAVWDIAFSTDPDQTFAYVADGMNEKVHVLRRQPLEYIYSFGSGGRMAGQFYGNAQHRGRLVRGTSTRRRRTRASACRSSCYTGMGNPMGDVGVPLRNRVRRIVIEGRGRTDSDPFLCMRGGARPLRARRNVGTTGLLHRNGPRTMCGDPWEPGRCIRRETRVAHCRMRGEDTMNANHCMDSRSDSHPGRSPAARAPEPPPGPPLDLRHNTRDLMAGMIDASADALWDAVGTILGRGRARPTGSRRPRRIGSPSPEPP